MRRGADPLSLADDDARLVARMATGDRGSLASLYDRHAPMMMSFAQKMLGSREESSDLLHDVFLEAWERAASYDPTRATVRGWLVLLLRSRALDRLGSARARRIVSFEHPDARSVDGSCEPPSQACLDARDALSRLSADVREVLELTYFLGLTAGEIADRLRVPVGTVKSRRARGLSMLAKTLEERSTP